ncbi:hypothetical protein [Pseudomonas fragi]|uniref:hypothetical protein n=1 Tax=Pseudomonas fragi TaxID=296 RepID=UPI000BA211D4|nr:hypothetical protein [Pseudomonas fragi]PAA08853.1 hypothetical protein CJU78_09135 [Pseudomonas fragi]
MISIKERPILFAAPMVRAILEGRKTVTRRPVKGLGLQWLEDFTPEYVAEAANSLCPYGKPGDRLWVRETTEVDEKTSPVVRLARYSADHQPVLYRHPEGDEYDGSVAHWDYPRRSRPSIHMPRWASRILLEITDVRVERLQDISEEQCIAEGIERHSAGFFGNGCSTAASAFKELWNSTGGDWATNPWVWAVSFRRVTP